MELLRTNNDEVRRSASWAVTVCAVDEPTAIEVGKYGYVTSLLSRAHVVQRVVRGVCM